MFVKKPHKKSAKRWKGKLKGVEANEEEKYDIDWTDDDANTHKFDPYIQVRPR